MKNKLVLTLLLLISIFVVSCGVEKTTEKSVDKAENEKHETSQKDAEKEKDTEDKKDEFAEIKEITPRELANNKNARLAIAMAVDKEYIQDELLNNGSIAADYFVTKGLSVDENGEDFRDKYPNGFISYDLEKSKEHWALAKKELGFENIELRLLSFDIESYKKVSEFIQAQLEGNLDGLKIVLDVQPLKNKLDMMKKKEFDLDSSGWGPDYADPMTFLDMFVTGGGYNTASYSNPKYDEIINSAKVGELASKPKERREALREAEKMLLEDAVLIPLFQRGKVWLQKPYLKDVVVNTLPPELTFRYASTSNDQGIQKIIRMISESDMATMDNSKATDTFSFSTMANVLEGLMMPGMNDTLVHGAAEKYDVSEDGKTYTFYLHKDSIWSNGKPVTAHDFVYSWRRLADPSTASQYQYMVKTAGILNSDAVMKGEKPSDQLGVKALDDYTLEVKLEVPIAYFTNLMSFPSFYPINQEFAEAKGDQFGTNPSNTLYNGPFVLQSWEFGFGFELRKNEKYREASSVDLDGIDFRIVKDIDAGVNLYETGGTDFVRLNGEFVERYMDSVDFRSALTGSLSYFTICIE